MSVSKERCFLYHADCLTGQIFEGNDIQEALDEGWKDHPGKVQKRDKVPVADELEKARIEYMSTFGRKPHPQMKLKNIKAALADAS